MEQKREYLVTVTQIRKINLPINAISEKEAIGEAKRKYLEDKSCCDYSDIVAVEFEIKE